MKEQQPAEIPLFLLDLRRSTRMQGDQYPSMTKCSVSTASSNQANRRKVLPQFQRFLAVFFLQSMRKQAVLAHQEQGRWEELVEPLELTTGEDASFSTSNNSQKYGFSVIFHVLAIVHFFRGKRFAS